MSTPRLAGPRVALVPAGSAAWDVVVDGASVGRCGHLPPDADGVVALTWAVAAEPDVVVEALGVLLAWTTAQEGVRGCLLDAAAGDAVLGTAAGRLGLAERRQVRGRVALVAGRVPVAGRHVC